MPNKPLRSFSRRQILIGLGVVGSGVTFCSCAGLSMVAYHLGRQMKEQHLVLEQATPQNTSLAPTSPAPDTPRPPIIPRDDWGAWPPDHSAVNESGFYSESNPEGWLVYTEDLQNVYQTLVLHHSAFYRQTDIRTMLEIQRQHHENRGWADVAYHFLVGQTGVIYEGRDWAARGTHVEGYNTGSIGVCLLGNFEVQQPSNAQLASTQRLVNWLATRLQLSHIAGHHHFNPQTQCPGDNLIPVTGQLAAGANLRIGTEGYIPNQAAEVTCECCVCNSE